MKRYKEITQSDWNTLERGESIRLDKQFVVRPDMPHKQIVQLIAEFFSKNFEVEDFVIPEWKIFPSPIMQGETFCYVTASIRYLGAKEKRVHSKTEKI